MEGRMSHGLLPFWDSQSDFGTQFPRVSTCQTLGGTAAERQRMAADRPDNKFCSEDGNSNVP